MAFVTLALLLFISLLGLSTTAEAKPTTHARRAIQWGVKRYEVWMLDQSDTATAPATTPEGKPVGYGGTLYIYDGRSLEKAVGWANTTEPLAKLNLEGETAALCKTQTDAYPIRPHMILFNNANTHASVSFVVSGHVVIFDVKTRKPLRCFRTEEGFKGFRQAHSAYPTPDDKYIIVTNQNGKKLERIRTDYATNTFTQELKATIDLTTCKTLSGLPCEDKVLRPDNAPICGFPLTTYRKNIFFVTLRGGGLFAVDVSTTPMTITSEYDADTVGGNGCGGIDVNERVFLVAGGATDTRKFNLDVYLFPAHGHHYWKGKKANKPAPKVLFNSSEDNRDGHGAGPAYYDKYVWVYDRIKNVAEVFDSVSGKHVNTVNLTNSLSSDPTPDLVAASPTGEFSFVTLRGPNPLSGGHAAFGVTPGLAVIAHTQKGKDGGIKAIVPVSNIPDEASGKQMADPHGISAVYIR